MNIFEYDDYKKFVNEWIAEQAQNGHGQLRRLALHLDANSVVMSQVFRGDRDLTLEQGLGTAKFIGLNELERDYFLLLVQRDRASNHELKNVFSGQIRAHRKSADSLKNRVKHQQFTDEDRAVFYSQWYYSAIRQGLSIPEYSSVSAVAAHLNLDRSLVSRVVDFLMKSGLIVEKKNGFELGPQVTHIGHDSPFVTRHHANWRMKGMQAMNQSSDSDLFYTGPMSLSEDAAISIRKKLVEMIEKTTKSVAASDSEVLHCLNIDWFGV